MASDEEQSSAGAEREPDPYTTHEGEISNDLRSIYNTLSGFGSARAKNARAREEIAELTHQLEQTAWGETKPMDHVPVIGDRIQEPEGESDAE